MLEPASFIGGKIDLAFALVQQGKVDACLSIVAGVRREGEISNLPDLAIKIICLEGICAQYSGDLTRSLERLRTAQVLGSRYGSIQTSLLTKGWLALGNYNAGRLFEAIRILGDACKSIELAEPSVRFRFASLLSMLHTYSREKRAAEDWFAVARREAAASGDRSTTSALIYNIAALRVSCALVEFVSSDERSIPPDFSSDFTFLKSAENYDSLVGVQNQFALHSLLQAQSLVILGDYSGALDRFLHFIGQECKTRASEYAKAEFGLLLCRIRLGLPIQTSSNTNSLLESLVEDDDLLFAHYVLVQLYRLVDERSMYDQCLRSFVDCRRRLASSRKEVQESLRMVGLHSIPANWPAWS